ncbi:MAG: hypothetical protein ACM3JG_07930 [Thiohalocapsa sp.]
MRTTVEIPDELFRLAKSEAALRGRKLKDLVEEGLRLVLAVPSAGSAEPPGRPARKPSLHDLAKDLIFEDAEGPDDLASNPKYFDDFGR